tara:strand:- start:8068 stop:8724 length:657 start_codon:yes stop_codon:yes gene_type:complete
MSKKFIFGIALLILLTTFISQKKFSINKFKIQEIEIKNNEILGRQEIIDDLDFLYNENIIFLNTFKIKKILKEISFIDGLNIKKIYPNKLEIKIFEKKPIAILINKGDKFFLSKKIELIEYREISKLNNLPVIYGDKKNFKILYQNLNKAKFPIDYIKQYNFLDSNRWDIEMIDKKIIKLPNYDYVKSLKSFLEIKDNRNVNKYKVFDFRLKNQLIMK